VFIGEILWLAADLDESATGLIACDGRLLLIADHAALFALIGTNYGGDGATTFAVPNLQQRSVVCAGAGAGLTPRLIGDQGGVDTVTLVTGELPAHTHALRVSAAAGVDAHPRNNVLAAGNEMYGDPGVMLGVPFAMAPGGGQPHENLPPSLGLNAYIVDVGIFPTT
jgi:microcystin-dependent protein